MPTSPPAFQETHFSKTPIRDLGLTIAGTELEPILAAFERSLEEIGLRKLRPRYYLSTEWGVPWGTVASAIPFYLARLDLIELHAERSGFVEGVGASDILRYLRHEMGHVVNYGYELYEQEEWIKLFGSITQPYVEEYRPEPFSPRYVRHLPGWYAQKHPDEDWAETFAVWMTPGLDWRSEYADWPIALAKLLYCERTLHDLGQKDPVVTSTELDEDVGELPYSLEDYYGAAAAGAEDFPAGLEGALRTIFDDLNEPKGNQKVPLQPASALLRRLERGLMANIFRWTGHFPERTRALVRHLARRADELQQGYPQDRDEQAALAVTTLVTALAMNHVYRGSYLP